jgi:hypothetical protein
MSAKMQIWTFRLMNTVRRSIGSGHVLVDWSPGPAYFDVCKSISGM